MTGCTTEDEFPAALWAHDLITCAAQLEVAVTYGYELAVIERYDDPAGEVLLDQLTGGLSETAADIKMRWPNVAKVAYSTDPVFGHVVAFVLDRAATLRTAAFAMAEADRSDRDAA